MKELVLTGKYRPILFLILLQFLIPSNTCHSGIPVSALSSAKLNVPAGNAFYTGVDPKGAFTAIRIPLKRVGKLFLIEASIGDQTGNFVFDTGASKLVLNHTYFRKDIWEAEERACGITGGVQKVYQTRVPRLDISDLYFENVLADVINLGHIENQRGVKILGLFGLNLFRNLEMVVDVSRCELMLYRIDKNGKRFGAIADTLQTSLVSRINMAGDVAFVSALMGGKSVNFCLDTGAEANVLSSSCCRKVLDTVTISKLSGLSGSGSSQSEVPYGTMNDFILCGQPLQPMETIIMDLAPLNLAYNYPLGGVLGYDFFKKGIVSINLVRKELSVCLNPTDNRLSRNLTANHISF